VDRQAIPFEIGRLGNVYVDRGRGQQLIFDDAV